MPLPGPADPAPSFPPAFPDGTGPPVTVRIGDPGELAAGLPQLLGYHPHESVVLVALAGESGRRVGLTVRADLPPPGQARALAAVLARSLATDRPRGALLMVVSEAPDDASPLLPPGPGGEPGTDLPHRLLVHELVLALDAVGIPLGSAVLVRDGRWWDFDCPDPCCDPWGGTPLPTGVGQLAVAAVAAGKVVAPTRDALADRLAPVAGAAGVAVERAVLRVAGEGRADVSTAWGRIRAAVTRARPGPDQEVPDDEELARLVWSLWQPDVRDRAVLLCLEDGAGAEALWSECTRRAPSPLDGFPAALVAICAYLRGDGALANTALDRALDSDPGNPLARLIADALSICVSPRQLRAMLHEAGATTAAELPGAAGS
ncbi:DUF4192 domain-containing protein [Blastococcus sp. TML/M2B]|uniref:DUF4192 domain-containing protein n=1 Tax=unclassified Blastococcus TaxID=2619396 RepID=UPI00190D5EF3|nr:MULTISPECIES: DUF4192 domain-containing protein [unclassified Blastococcus]MBN1093243.1 DUF4192 domain-containing protein [Blastococcus sp. TML/M2B]MBN1096645.1 DUF4192 domain-containing protein [Blastococcus sp. TML/C7B]